MGPGDSAHHRLDVLGLADPQTQVDGERLPAQTEQGHGLSGRFDDRPQLMYAHNYAEVVFLPRKVIDKRPQLGTLAGTFKLWRRWGRVPTRLSRRLDALTLSAQTVIWSKRKCVAAVVSIIESLLNKRTLIHKLNIHIYAKTPALFNSIYMSRKPLSECIRVPALFQ